VTRPRPPLDLYVILDPGATAGRDLEAVADAVLAAGGRWLQLRHKTASTGELAAVAGRLVARVRAAGGVLIVNDRLDVALAVGADGVHLGQDDLPVAAARPLLRPGMVLGRSTHSVAQARDAQAEGADYIAVGSMFPTQTKPDFRLVGPELIRTIRPRITAPLVGIGGVTRENVAQVIRAGADGVAVISAVCGAPDPAAATRDFLAAIRAARVT
jgi:thiamine-phosphate pyrophosphorylase